MSQQLEKKMSVKNVFDEINSRREIVTCVEKIERKGHRREVFFRKKLIGSKVRSCGTNSVVGHICDVKKNKDWDRFLNQFACNYHIE